MVTLLKKKCMNAPTQWTVCCDTRCAFGAVSSCYLLKCTVPSLALSFPRAFSSSLRRLPSCSIEGYSVRGCSPPEISETLTLCESKADPTLEESYRRATTQEPIMDGGSLVSPGLASQRDRFLTAKAGPTALINANVLNAQMPWGGHP